MQIIPSKVGYSAEYIKKLILPNPSRIKYAAGPITAKFGSNRLIAAILKTCIGFANEME